VTRISLQRLAVGLGAATTIALSVSATAALSAQSAPLATPPASCTTKAYAYAGIAGNVTSRGIKATVTTLASAVVPNGHVAGWIGVGGVDAGPNGQPEWLQAGLNTVEGGGSELYAELTRPAGGTTYTTLLAQVQPGTSYRLAVIELPGRPGVWQVWLNGKPAIAAVSLTGSHGSSGKFQPMAMTESWNGGVATCNGFAYRFGGVQVATDPGTWRSLTNASTVSDTGYHITHRTNSGFTALSS
jgi:hypothetical protein